MTHLTKYVLHLGDNSLILSHRLSEYSSKGPFLEEDLAISNIALDHLGQAELLLRYAGQLEGQGRSEDDLAYRRPENEYFNFQLVEQPNSDFAHIMVRQYFMDVFNFLLYSFLKDSTDETLAAIASRAVKEVRYHLRKSSEWIVRLGKGTEESKERVQNAIDNLWMYTGEFFEEREENTGLIQDKIIPAPNDIKSEWKKHVSEILVSASLEYPTNDYMATGSISGIHTEHLGHILSEMQYLQRAYPDAKW